MDGSTYAAVVLYYRRGEAIVDTLRHLQNQTVPPNRIVLVDNASGDGVIDRLDADGALDDVTVLRLAANGGYGAGMNAGAAVEEARDVDYLLLVTHELLTAPTCAEELLRAADATGAAAVGPSLRLPDGSVWANGGRLDLLGGARHHRGEITTPREVTWLDGACLLVRGDAFRTVGGIDESFFLYWEDVDFSLALHRRGPVIVAPAAHATQSPSDGAGPAYYYSRNRLWTWRRQRAPLKIGLSVLELAAWGLKLLLTSGPASALAVLRGCRDGLLRTASLP